VFSADGTWSSPIEERMRAAAARALTTARNDTGPLEMNANISRAFDARQNREVHALDLYGDTRHRITEQMFHGI